MAILFIIILFVFMLSLPATPMEDEYKTGLKVLDDKLMTPVQYLQAAEGRLRTSDQTRATVTVETPPELTTTGAQLGTIISTDVAGLGQILGIPPTTEGTYTQLGTMIPPELTTTGAQLGTVDLVGARRDRRRRRRDSRRGGTAGGYGDTIAPTTRDALADTPTFSDFDQTVKPGGPPGDRLIIIPPDIPGDYKVLVKRDSLYLFQDYASLSSNPDSNVRFQGYNNPNLLSTTGWETLNDNGYRIADPMRRWTLRLWYTYGQNESQLFTRSNVSSPLFGYFPVTNQNYETVGYTDIGRRIESDLNNFYDEFEQAVVPNDIEIFRDALRQGGGFTPNSGRVTGGGSLTINSKNYFDKMLLKPMPLVYIKEFGTEHTWHESLDDLGIVDDFGHFYNIFNSCPDVRIANWERSIITIKKFNALDLDPRIQDSDIDFRTIVEEHIEPFLNLKERGMSAPPYCEEVPGGIDIPKRYYDFAFQLPLADDQVDITSQYEGYVREYENTTNMLTSRLESIIPNLYIVDFADTSIEEYYNLLGLISPSPTNYPNGYISQFAVNYAPGTQAYRDLVNSFGYTSEHSYSRLWSQGITVAQAREPGGLIKLADKYDRLIFSDLYREKYNTTSRDAVPTGGSSWVPMYGKADFSIHFDTNIYNSMFSEAALAELPDVYDPLVNLISDTEITVPKQKLFVGAHVNNPMRAEISRRPETDNGSTVPRALGSKKLAYEVSNVWNMHEWFNLYCVPDVVNSDDAWGAFFAALPEQSPMLDGAPQTWNPASVQKPMPVGGLAGRLDQTLPDVITTFVDEGTILKTPDGTEWNTCAGASYVVRSLTELYNNIKETLTTGFRSGHEGFRTYKEVMDGKLAYSESLFYRLEKRDTFTGRITQNYFFPANLLRDGFTYVDAQVRYGAEYEYSLYGYYFVVGNEYWYENTEQLSPRQPGQSKPGSSASGAQTAGGGKTPVAVPTSAYGGGQTTLGTIPSGGEILKMLENSGNGNIQMAKKNSPATKTTPTATIVAALNSGGFREWKEDSHNKGNAPIDAPTLGRILKTGGIVLDNSEEPVLTRYEQIEDINNAVREGSGITSVAAKQGTTMAGESSLGEAGTSGATGTDRAIDWGAADWDNITPTGEPNGADSDSGKIPPVVTTPYDSPDSMYSFAVHNRPHFVLVETSVFSPDKTDTTVRIIDKAPVPPDLSIVPYRSVNNRILLLLNGNVGEYKARPILINESDYSLYKQIILNQKLPQDFLGGAIATRPMITRSNIENFDINFGSDDYAKTFEIYRIDFAPTSYQDFAGARVTTLSNTAQAIGRHNSGAGPQEETMLYDDDHDHENPAEDLWSDRVVVTSNSTIDSVVPNKKYWYTTRVIDVHGNVSNPTGVLQFEMVDTGNSIFPVIRDYSFPVVPTEYTRQGKRFIRISPSSIQESVPAGMQSAEAFLTSPQLGVGVERPVWNKKYKLRVTSKTTGKKVDINFSFKQKSVNTDKLIPTNQTTNPIRGTAINQIVGTVVGSIGAFKP